MRITRWPTKRRIADLQTRGRPLKRIVHHMETALAVNDKTPAATAVALGATKVTSK